jgi:hypothetical protein
VVRFGAFHPCDPATSGECPVYGYEEEQFWVKYQTFADFLETYFGLQVD